MDTWYNYPLNLDTGYNYPLNMDTWYNYPLNLDTGYYPLNNLNMLVCKNAFRMGLVSFLNMKKGEEG